MEWFQTHLNRRRLKALLQLTFLICQTIFAHTLLFEEAHAWEPRTRVGRFLFGGGSNSCGPNGCPGQSYSGSPCGPGGCPPRQSYGGSPCGPGGCPPGQGCIGRGCPGGQGCIGPGCPGGCVGPNCPANNNYGAPPGPPPGPPGQSYLGDNRLGEQPTGPMPPLRTVEGPGPQGDHSKGSAGIVGEPEQLGNGYATRGRMLFGPEPEFENDPNLVASADVQAAANSGDYFFYKLKNGSVTFIERKHLRSVIDISITEGKFPPGTPGAKGCIRSDDGTNGVRKWAEKGADTTKKATDCIYSSEKKLLADLAGKIFSISNPEFKKLTSSENVMKLYCARMIYQELNDYGTSDSKTETPDDKAVAEALGKILNPTSPDKREKVSWPYKSYEDFVSAQGDKFPLSKAQMTKYCDRLEQMFRERKLQLSAPNECDSNKEDQKLIEELATYPKDGLEATWEKASLMFEVSYGPLKKVRLFLKDHIGTVPNANYGQAVGCTRESETAGWKCEYIDQPGLPQGQKYIFTDPSDPSVRYVTILNPPPPVYKKYAGDKMTTLDIDQLKDIFSAEGKKWVIQSKIPLIKNSDSSSGKKGAADTTIEGDESKIFKKVDNIIDFDKKNPKTNEITIDKQGLSGSESSKKLDPFSGYIRVCTPKSCEPKGKLSENDYKLEVKGKSYYFKLQSDGQGFEKYQSVNGKLIPLTEKELEELKKTPSDEITYSPAQGRITLKSSKTGPGTEPISVPLPPFKPNSPTTPQAPVPKPDQLGPPTGQTNPKPELAKPTGIEITFNQYSMPPNQGVCGGCVIEKDAFSKDIYQTALNTIAKKYGATSIKWNHLYGIGVKGAHYPHHTILAKGNGKQSGTYFVGNHKDLSSLQRGAIIDGTGTQADMTKLEAELAPYIEAAVGQIK